jgi:sporulation protein YlmC with PRC-barrel domain
MHKLNLAACTLATALLATSAMAQTNPAPSAQAPAAAPSTAAPSVAPTVPMTGTSASGATTGQMQFYTNMSANQWRASKFVGVDIYGANNEKIGDVNDIIIDNQGNINAVVIGVGGFLGIGEKDVAIPFRTVEWTMNDRAMNRSAANSTMGTPAAPATAPATAPANSAMNAAPKNTDVTGTTVSGTSTSTYPDHGVLRMTKQDLQNAPSFRYADSNDARTTGGVQNPVPAGTKP